MWLHQQIVKVFEQSKRAVQVCNDKHLSASWNEAKWMFDKFRERNFPLFGRASIPFYYRQPDVELDIDSPMRASIVPSAGRTEGGIFHSIDVLNAAMAANPASPPSDASADQTPGPSSPASTSPRATSSKPSATPT